MTDGHAAGSQNPGESSSKSQDGLMFTMAKVDQGLALVTGGPEDRARRPEQERMSRSLGKLCAQWRHEGMEEAPCTELHAPGSQY